MVFFWSTIASDFFSIFVVCICFAMCFYVKNITLRVVLLIFAYPLFHLLYLKNGGEPIRILVFGDDFYYPYYGTAFWVYVLSFISFTIPLVKSPLRSSWGGRYVLIMDIKIFYILIFLFYLCAFLAHPWSFGLGDRREQTSLSGIFNALYVSFFVICALAKPVGAKSKYFILYVAILPLFLILTGERVNNILMLFVLVMFSPLISKDIRTSLSSSKGILVLVVCISGALFAGQLREAQFSEDYSELSLIDLFNYITAVESLHVYIASFWYADTFGLSIDSFLNVLYSFIPLSDSGGAGSPLFYEKIIREQIPTVGGGIFLSQFILSFGGYGAVIFSFLFSLLLIYIARTNSFFGYLFLVLFVTMGFRFFWYGVIYLIPSLYTMYLPLIALMFFNLVKVAKSDDS